MFTAAVRPVKFTQNNTVHMFLLIEEHVMQYNSLAH